MKELIKAIEKLSDEEEARANCIHPLFHSSHEAYGVIKEEVEEAEIEYRRILTDLDNYWQLTRFDQCDRSKKEQLVELRRRAIALAAEAVQVSAMAKKAITSQEVKL